MVGKLTVCLRKMADSPKKPKPANTEPQQLKSLPHKEREVARRALTALASGVAMEVVYSGSPRIVEVHAVGVSTAGKPCMRVYQLQGATDSGEEQGWKLMSLAKVFEMPKLVDIHSLAPREGYRKGDMAMTQIFTEL